MGRVFRHALPPALLLLAAWPAPLSAGGRGRVASLLPHRLLYVIPADVERTLTVGTPELGALQDTLAALFVASLDGQLLSLFENRTVLRTTATEDSQLAAALADRSLFNRYDDLVVGRATLEGPGPAEAPGLMHAKVVVTFRPWDPADTLTLTGRSESGGSGETPEAAARLALERAVRQVGDALARRKALLVR